jgi:hypothetical protein
MKNLAMVLGVIALTFTLHSRMGRAAEQEIVDGVRQSSSEPPRLAAVAALSAGSIDFETPQLFSDTLPLQVFQSFKTEAFFLGTGAVVDITSFEVQGATGRSALGFNGRIGVNGDGTVPQLPEFVVFLAPYVLGLSPQQTVSIDVGSSRDAGRFVTLVAYNIFLIPLDSDVVQLTPQMQTLTVSSALPDIVFVGLFGEEEAKVLAADNLTYNKGAISSAPSSAPRLLAPRSPAPSSLAPRSPAPRPTGRTRRSARGSK